MECTSVTLILFVLTLSRHTPAPVKPVSLATVSPVPMSMNARSHLLAQPIPTAQILSARTSAAVKLASKDRLELVRTKTNALTVDTLAILQACVRIQSARSNAPVTMDSRTTEMDAWISTSARSRLVIQTRLAQIWREATNALVKMDSKAMECFA